nr:reverse transcriptase domain-containing protein [Tanacetum cinerariifolium]
MSSPGWIRIAHRQKIPGEATTSASGNSNDDATIAYGAGETIGATDTRGSEATAAARAPRQGLFPVDIRRPPLGVKLLGRAVSRDAYFISGLAMRRALNVVDLMGLLSQLHDEQSELLLRRSCGSIENMVVYRGPFFGDLQWRLVSLHIRFEGLGLYSSNVASSYAFVASRAQSWVLIDHILRDSGICGINDDYVYVLDCFRESNYEIIESLLRDRQRKIRNEDLRTELEYFNEDYDEEHEMEPRPEQTREGSKTRSNTEGNRPSKAEAEENERREMNLPYFKGSQKLRAASSYVGKQAITRHVQEEAYTRNNISKSPPFEGREISFPLVTKGRNSSASIVKKAKIFKREVGRVHMDSDSSCEEISWAIGEVLLEITISDAPLLRSETINFFILRSNSLYNMLLGRTTMQKIGIVVSTIHGAIKFHTTQGVETMFLTYKSNKIREGVKKIKETSLANTEGVLSCTDDEEKIIINSKTITVDGKPFNTKHKLNEYSHIKAIEQKRRSLGPDRSTAARKKVEKLTRAGLLMEATHQTWVANPVMVKKSDEGWRMIPPKVLPGCLQRLPSDPNGRRRQRKDNILRRRKGLLLPKDALRFKKRRSNVSNYSRQEEDKLTGIMETFQRFRSINMKLNPKKFSFGVEEGPLLRHLITKKGTRANPLKEGSREKDGYKARGNETKLLVEALY